MYSLTKDLLAPKNNVVNEMNFQIQNKIAGELMAYKSIPLLTKIMLSTIQYNREKDDQWALLKLKEQ